jgi:hypothetical protein
MITYEDQCIVQFGLAVTAKHFRNQKKTKLRLIETRDIPVIRPIHRIHPYFSSNMLTRAVCRRFATILPTGEKVEREMSNLEREIMRVRESEFSKLGLYRKMVTNEKSLYRLFDMAHKGSKVDYSACMYAMNMFYNFGVEFNDPEFTSRWLTLAMNTGRFGEAVDIIKFYNTWLPHPPRSDLICRVMEKVRIDQTREILKSVRLNSQIEVIPKYYEILINKELNEMNDEIALNEILILLKDLKQFNFNINLELLEKIKIKSIESNLNYDLTEFIETK